MSGFVEPGTIWRHNETGALWYVVGRSEGGSRPITALRICTSGYSMLIDIAFTTCPDLVSWLNHHTYISDSKDFIEYSNVIPFEDLNTFKENPDEYFIQHNTHDDVAAFPVIDVTPGFYFYKRTLSADAQEHEAEWVVCTTRPTKYGIGDIVHVARRDGSVVHVRLTQELPYVMESDNKKKIRWFFDNVDEEELVREMMERDNSFDDDLAEKQRMLDFLFGDDYYDLDSSLEVD